MNCSWPSVVLPIRSCSSRRVRVRGPRLPFPRSRPPTWRDGIFVRPRHISLPSLLIFQRLHCLHGKAQRIVFGELLHPGAVWGSLAPLALLLFALLCMLSVGKLVLAQLLLALRLLCVVSGLYICFPACDLWA